MNLKEERIKKCLTQIELSVKANVGIATIRAIEQGKREPSPLTLSKLKKALEG